MPTYHCAAPANVLDAARKAAIANAITRVHSEVTGAPGFFAEVIFRDVPAGDWFVGGEPLEGDQIFVHGNIRAGRSAEIRHELISRLAGAVATAAGVPVGAMWIYISELPSRAMMEFGHVLPEPGEETSWTAALPEEDRAHMEAIGRHGGATGSASVRGSPRSDPTARIPIS